MLNCNGWACDAVRELRRLRPDVMLLTEPHRSPVPWPPGWYVLEAPRPRGRGGGVAVLVRNGVVARLWRMRAEDGAIWVEFPGLLADGHTLVVALCYLPPPSTRAWRREAAADWLERLAADWMAAVGMGWVPMVAGDVNARTGTLPHD